MIAHSHIGDIRSALLNLLHSLLYAFTSELSFDPNDPLHDLIDFRSESIHVSLSHHTSVETIQTPDLGDQVSVRQA